MKKALALFALLLLFNLAACASKKEEKEQEAQEQEQQEKELAEAKKAAETYKPKLICPQVAILRDLETIRDYTNDKPAPDQLMAAARMEEVAGDCGYQDTGIDIVFRINMVAAKGPRLSGDQAGFPFFVAVVDPDGKVLNKDQLTEKFTFKGEETSARHDVPVHVFIPLPKDKNVTGPNYRVLAGFQLTQKQLKEARKKTSPR